MYLIVFKPKEYQVGGVVYLFNKRGFEVIIDPRTNLVFLKVEKDFLNASIKVLITNGIPYEVYQSNENQRR